MMVVDEVVSAFGSETYVEQSQDIVDIITSRISASELLFLRTLMSEKGFVLFEICPHKEWKKIVVRFKRISHESGVFGK